MNEKRGYALHASAFTIVLLISTSLTGWAQTPSPGGPTTTSPGTTTGAAPGTTTIGPGGVPIAPGQSATGVPTQTISPGGIPIAPGPAGMVGSGRVGTQGGPSTSSSSGCGPGTASTSLAQAPVIISPEPGQPPEVVPQSPSGTTSGSGGTVPGC